MHKFKFGLRSTNVKCQRVGKPVPKFGKGMCLSNSAPHHGGRWCPIGNFPFIFAVMNSSWWFWFRSANWAFTLTTHACAAIHVDEITMLPIGPKMFPIPLSSKNTLNYCHSEFVGLSANCIRFICRKSSCIAPTSSRKEWIRRDKSPGTEFYALAHLPSPSSIDLFLLRCLSVLLWGTWHGDLQFCTKHTLRIANDVSKNSNPNDAHHIWTW